jgi:hypothetical protein
MKAIPYPSTAIVMNFLLMHMLSLPLLSLALLGCSFPCSFSGVSFFSVHFGFIRLVQATERFNQFVEGTLAGLLLHRRLSWCILCRWERRKSSRRFRAGGSSCFPIQSWVLQWIFILLVFGYYTLIFISHEVQLTLSERFVTFFFSACFCVLSFAVLF